MGNSASLFDRLWFYFTEPAAYHCKPLVSRHEWIRSDISKYPICKKCGKVCWWMDGYMLNSGTILNPDNDARRIQMKRLMKPQMGNSALKLEPHDITENCWWYEEEKGINVVVEHRSKDGATYYHTAQYMIPWSQVRSALSRKDLSRRRD